MQKSDNEIVICPRLGILNLFTIDIEMKSRQILKYRLKISYTAYLHRYVGRETEYENSRGDDGTRKYCWE